MKLLISFIFLFQGAWAQNPQKKILKAEDIIYRPGKAQGRFTISYKDYQDIRIDTDRDGVIDLWYVKKGPLEVEVLFEKGQPTRWGARHTSRGQVKVFDYVMNDQNFALNAHSTRPTRLMNLEDSCGVEQIREKIKSYANDIKYAALAQDIKTYLVDKSCQTKDEVVFEKISLTLGNILKGNSPIRSCISSEKFKNAFGETKEAQAAAELFAAKFELQALELSEKAKDHSPLITCEKHSSQDKVMSTDESTSRIHIDLNSFAALDGRAQSKAISSSSFAHELIHRAGLKNEEEVASVEKFCAQQGRQRQLALSDTKMRSFGHVFEADIKEGNSIAAKDSTATISPEAAQSKPGSREPASSKLAASAGNNSSTSPGSVATPTQTAASNTTASIPTSMTVAQTQIPAAPKLSESISNPPQTTEVGTQQALVQSASESSGVLRVANNIVGAMNTRAAASGDLATNDTSKSSKSELGTGTKATSSTPSKTKSDAFAAFSRKTVGSDEKIVEQITLDGSNIQPASAGPSAPKNSASTEVTQPTATQRPPASPGTAQGEVARASSSGGSGSGGGFDISTPNVGGTGGPSRAPAAVNPSIEAKNRGSTQKAEPAQQSAPTATSRDEVVTFISKGSYRTTKEKLQKPEFRQQLESQKITVLDLYGNTVGATKGEVIFLDQGDRFVRQK